jgi:hypothetical protein
VSLAVSRAVLLMSLLALAGCGFADQNAFLPSFMRQAAAPSLPQEPYPDVLALARTQGRGLFVERPDKIEISTPLFNSFEQLYAVCVRAPVTSPTGAQSTLTIYVTIARSSFFVRRRAEPGDRCEGLDYDTVATE